ncbi:hypothetical protein [Symbiobacterium terraclitae]|uniref:hypothetical protein n=1 Tax=Symbiobacterium terraclitae TaxID=557451 RepID=UPI0035B56401
MPRTPICPVDRAAMIQGDDGVWRCRRQSRHEFRVLGGGQPRPLGPLTYSSLGNMACPACGAEMAPVIGEVGAWVCLADERHRLDLHPRLVCAPPTETMPRTKWTERSGGGVPLTHWLAGIGITAVLLPPPQASGGDGSYCQPLGDIRPGGGSKSGRRRRKKPKGGKTIPPLEPWGA